MSSDRALCSAWVKVDGSVLSSAAEDVVILEKKKLKMVRLIRRSYQLDLTLRSQQVKYVEKTDCCCSYR